MVCALESALASLASRRLMVWGHCKKWLLCRLWYADGRRMMTLGRALCMLRRSRRSMCQESLWRGCASRQLVARSSVQVDYGFLQYLSMRFASTSVVLLNVMVRQGSTQSIFCLLKLWSQIRHLTGGQVISAGMQGITL